MSYPGQPRIGYAPYNASLRAPGDRRRFVAYAKSRRLAFELAQPGECYDLVVITTPADITYWAARQHGKIVYDLIDSYLAVDNTTFRDRFRGPYKFLTGAHRRLKWDYREAVKRMCRRATAVVCSTEEQKRDISNYCENVHVILDAHHTVTKTRKETFEAEGVFKIAWEGLPSNLPQLNVIRNALRTLNAEQAIELHVITDPIIPRFWGHFGRIETNTVAKKVFANVVCHPWEEASCAALICACDLAVIPIDLSDPFTRGKPENKLALLWKMGMPVVVSATPAYERTMSSAGLDHVCRTEADWIRTIREMMDSKKSRRTAALKGYEHATTNYTEARIFSRWDSVFASCGFDFALPTRRTDMRTGAEQD
jgi:glycosyltransferase involved in cell wall biosynthesis